MAKLDIQDKITIIQDSKKGTYTFGATTLVVIILLLVFAIRPTVQTIFSLRSEIKSKRSLHSDLETKIANLSQLEKKYNNELSDNFDDLEMIYPAKGDFSLMMANLEEVTADNNFELISISFGDSDYEEDPGSINTNVLRPWKATISVRGKRENLILLLQDIESFANYPIIESVSFTNEELEDGRMVFTIGVRIYKVDDPEFYE